MNIFLSRPNWVQKDYEAGLRIFITKLNDLGLNPRTIGNTDFPVQSPLDEVIRVMGECRGAIILGYPQIIISQGAVKGEKISSTMQLPTEWNHIEAGLAYARKMPMLVAHHTGVTRGIFDRGALNSFIFEKDFSHPDWSAHEDISGALRAWKDSVINSTPEKRSVSNSVMQEIERQKNIVWTAIGVGRKINNSKPLAPIYRESAEVRIQEVNEHYVVIKMLSTDENITVPLQDLIISYDQNRHRPAVEIRSLK